MKYLFRHSRKIFVEINKAPNIYLFLDYDGTLAPVVKKPELANLPKESKSILLKLMKNPKFSIAIISGRSIKQLKGKVKIKDIALAGNHGLEMELPSGTSRRGVKSPTLKYVHPLARKIRPVAKNIKHKLDIACKPIKGAFLEDKGLTLSLHYRMVKNKKDVEKLKQRVKAITSPYLKRKKIKITTGKKVIEIRPPIKWDKGSLVDFLLKKIGTGTIFSEEAPIKKLYQSHFFLPIYIGDDETDESAFKRLKKKGITIFVGGKNTVSNAEYYVRDTKEVFRFLKKLGQVQFFS